MAKYKAFLIVVFLVGSGAVAALLALNHFFQTHIQSRIESRLEGADKHFVAQLRVKAFSRIQALSRYAGNEKLLSALGRLPNSNSGLSEATLQNSFKLSREELLPILEDIKQQTQAGTLIALSTEGKITARLPERSSFGQSMIGLPAFTECIQGISRDGFYELEGKLRMVTVIPLKNKRGRMVGCLMSTDVFGATEVQALLNQSGLDAAVFLRKKLVISTLQDRLVEPIAAQLDSQDPIYFGRPTVRQPFLVNFEGKGFAARTTQLAGGTDVLHVAAILSLDEYIASFRNTQNTIFIGIGALLVIGLVLSFALFRTRSLEDKEAVKLCDAVATLVNGNSSNIQVEGYSGVYREIAHYIARLASAGSLPTPSVVSASVSDLLGKPDEPPAISSSPQTDAAERKLLDFENLLDSESGNRFSKTPSSPTSEPVFGSASLDTQSSPPVQPASPAAGLESLSDAPASLPSSQPSGPTLELPGELADMLDQRGEHPDSQSPFPPQAPVEQNQPTLASQDLEEDPFMSPTKPVPDLAPSSSSSPDSSKPPLASPLLGDQAASVGFEPDATVVAEVPDQLLRAASGPGFDTEEETNPMATPMPPEVSPKPDSIENPAPELAEDSHFREVFEQFVKTKNQCGESTVGITFDRFAEKLRKNTSDLKVRYKCNSVKFQVYVKNGKAALKATPIK